ncbi:MAG: hypothetical protein ABIW48_08450, partial [Burkholderiales bacterium]
MTILSILFIGLLLGMKHATEADHLAAMATLVSHENSLARSMKLGVAWGIGHTLTLMLFGGIVLALGKAISQRLEQALELTVGLMLIGLGADVLRRLLRQRIHFHIHRHEPGTAHLHAHSHAGESPHRYSLHRHAHAQGLPLRQWPVRAGLRRAGTEAGSIQYRHAHVQGSPLRALAVGIMHGMAGSAALILLSLETVQSWTMGLVYIACFGAGSIAGMALLSVAITIPL